MRDPRSMFADWAHDEVLRLRAEIERLREALRPLLSAAEGLSHGTDWNHGTHAKDHGYRQKLLDAIPAARAALSGEEDT